MSLEGITTSLAVELEHGFLDGLGSGQPIYQAYVPFFFGGHRGW